MIFQIRDFLKRWPLAARFSKWIYLRFVQLFSARKLRRVAENKVVKLELGSGRKKGKDGWVTVDLHGADINYDLRNGLPLREGCVDAIYTSHMFEHIPFRHLVPLIAECRRVLKKGGYLSVCVPNAKYYIDAYVNGTEFKNSSQPYFETADVDTNSLIDQVNYVAYMDSDHAYMFDEQNLVNTIAKGGFEDVKLREFDDGIDLKERDYESIYAVAIK